MNSASNENLQAVKLRAIARGLGATLTKDNEQFFFLLKWDEFLTASAHYGSWKQKGRIIFRAHHPYRHSDRTEITVSASRPTTDIVRDVERRFVPDAREFYRACEEKQRQTNEKALNEKLRIQSLLDELGADYKTAQQQARHSRDDFNTHGVSFSKYDVSEKRNNCRVSIDCSEHCLRHILRLVRADYEFLQSLKKKGAQS